MMGYAQNMVWFPVRSSSHLREKITQDLQICYAVILIPVTIARLQSFAGKSVSFEVTVFTDVVFNMTGLVNVTLHITMSRFYPDMDVVPLPDFHTQRTHRAKDALVEAGGVTPFTLTQSDVSESYRAGRTAPRVVGIAPERRSTLDAETKLQEDSLTRQNTMNTVSSFSSTAELISKEE